MGSYEIGNASLSAAKTRHLDEGEVPNSVRVSTNRFDLFIPAGGRDAIGMTCHLGSPRQRRGDPLYFSRIFFGVSSRMLEAASRVLRELSKKPRRNPEGCLKKVRLRSLPFSSPQSLQIKRSSSQMSPRYEGYYF